MPIPQKMFVTWEEFSKIRKFAEEMEPKERAAELGLLGAPSSRELVKEWKAGMCQILGVPALPYELPLSQPMEVIAVDVVEQRWEYAS
jgi:hypothetical protein